MLHERGVVVTYETIRCWYDKFGVGFAQCAKAARRKPGSTWHLDEMFVTLRGEPYLLWRAVDELGEIPPLAEEVESAYDERKERIRHREWQIDKIIGELHQRASEPAVKKVK